MSRSTNDHNSFRGSVLFRFDWWTAQWSIDVDLGRIQGCGWGWQTILELQTYKRWWLRMLTSLFYTRRASLMVFAFVWKKKATQKQTTGAFHNLFRQTSSGCLTPKQGSIQLETLRGCVLDNSQFMIVDATQFYSTWFWCAAVACFVDVCNDCLLEFKCFVYFDCEATGSGHLPWLEEAPVTGLAWSVQRQHGYNEFVSA